MNYWKKMLPGFIIDINYENLITNPKKEIFWLIKNYGDELKDSQIAKLIGSTKSTINAI